MFGFSVNDDCTDNERYCHSTSTCQEGSDGNSYCKVKGKFTSKHVNSPQKKHFSSSTVGEDCNGVNECISGAECGIGGICNLIGEY